MKVDCISDSDDFNGVIFLKSEETKEPMKIIDEEERRYIKESSLGLSAAPLQWWRLYQYKYPNIVRLILYYLHISGSSMSSEPVFSTAGAVLQNTKHSHSSSDNVDLLVLLQP